MPELPTLLPALGADTLVCLLLLYAVAAVFSGLSGFGLSAIGGLSLLALPPQQAVPLLMALSLACQLGSFGSLWTELRPHVGPWGGRNAVLPYLAGGLAGLPVGLAVLTSCGAGPLTATLGALLVAYATWSLLRPPGRVRLQARGGRRCALLVGAVGGLVGGFSAFPSCALVVWNGLTGASKAQSRALTQPFIMVMQVCGLGLLLAAQPQVFGAGFWRLLAVALPAALLGNRLGVAIYRRTGDLGYHRITLLALGLSGAGLLLKVSLP